MNSSARYVVIIPALNEEASIGSVIQHIPQQLITEIVVVDNGSTDQTPTIAQSLGATVLYEPNKGYGAACLKGLEYLRASHPLPEAVLFLDGDFSDHPEQCADLISALEDTPADMVVGSRTLGRRTKGSLTPQQIFGNALATFLIRLIHGHRYTDLGPFRIIRYIALERLKMADRNYGWTVEMQIKAIQHKLRITEIPVRYRNRIGKSKVSGTLKGSILAGYKIILTILKYSR